MFRLSQPSSGVHRSKTQSQIISLHSYQEKCSQQCLKSKNISFIWIQRPHTETHWTIVNYIIQKCLWKVKLGNFETNIFPVQLCNFCSRLTLQSYKDKSFSVIIKYCNSMMNLKNLKYTHVNKLSIEFHNISKVLTLSKSYDEPYESEIYSCLQV
jgi:hypothetical protein